MLGTLITVWCCDWINFCLYQLRICLTSTWICWRLLFSVPLLSEQDFSDELCQQACAIDTTASSPTSVTCLEHRTKLEMPSKHWGFLKNFIGVLNFAGQYHHYNAHCINWICYMRMAFHRQQLRVKEFRFCSIEFILHFINTQKQNKTDVISLF